MDPCAPLTPRSRRLIVGPTDQFIRHISLAFELSNGTLLEIAGGPGRITRDLASFVALDSHRSTIRSLTGGPPTQGVSKFGGNTLSTLSRFIGMHRLACCRHVSVQRDQRS